MSENCQCAGCQSENIRHGLVISKCTACDVTLNVGSRFQFIESKLICGVCVEKMYMKCQICGERHKRDHVVQDFQFRDGKIVVCKPCLESRFKTCHICKKQHYKSDMCQHGGALYCHACFNEHFETCPACQTTHSKGSCIHLVWGGTHRVCPKCWGFYGPILRYDTKPKMKFHGKGEHFYGVELEVEVEGHDKYKRGLLANEVVNLFGDFVITKEDGSLTTGFEICTQPASIEEHKGRWNRFFDAKLKGLVSFQTVQAGLHIHCSRLPLSLLTIGKMLLFINDSNNKDFVELIAGRTTNQYCKIMKKKWSDCQPRPRNRDDRREAINLLNKDTIEFRIFKGTLKRESLFKALEFCDALTKFCMAGTYSIKFCQKLDNFINYVKTNRKEFPYLYAFILAKWLKQENDKWVKLHGFDAENQTEL